MSWTRAVSWCWTAHCAPAQKINARFAPEAVVGSSTESTDNTYDLFVAIPAPAQRATFSGTLSLHESGISRRRDRQHAERAVLPHASRRPGTCRHFGVRPRGLDFARQPLTQPVTGATYTLRGRWQRHARRGRGEYRAVAQRRARRSTFGERKYRNRRIFGGGRARYPDRREGDVRRVERDVERAPSSARACASIRRATLATRARWRRAARAR